MNKTKLPSKRTSLTQISPNQTSCEENKHNPNDQNQNQFGENEIQQKPKSTTKARLKIRFREELKKKKKFRSTDEQYQITIQATASLTQIIKRLVEKKKKHTTTNPNSQI
eukprot:TRINITY_DN33194_c0_g2_i1.p1 TRINITY_DN33194_c0_g2~~TRINITY_DN33194_c0_g2_i1.p1  ORF type:complete len:110 (-),score=6.14 TRINITY_DN33194_c0_g2_i1:624-953(-)